MFTEVGPWVKSALLWADIYRTFVEQLRLLGGGWTLVAGPGSRSDDILRISIGLGRETFTYFERIPGCIYLVREIPTF